ncbi:hypothetical protein [Ferruginibacter albus]|uniref:hypothetical protein n=1 Tax=Ferruginibacter albus TaxID=2875540 RepID=UPI001CC4A851|nr:hypothetical protein [Ferruginibacter albus]UAY52046.1 hypothetical protein K9M53_15830 [Ferruginibacter albus]
MNKPNRNLLVLFSQKLNPEAMEHEVDMLHELLYVVEHSENIFLSHEIIDLNKYNISSNVLSLRKLFRQRDLKPFIFLNNKN